MPADHVAMQEHGRAALAFMAAGNYRGAALHLAEMLEQDPVNMFALSHLAALFVDSGALDRAEDLILRGLDTDPRIARFHHLLGRVLLRRGQPDLALAPLDQACRLAPLNPDSWTDFLDAIRLSRRNDVLRVTVITPTTGDPGLTRAAASVRDQSHPAVDHLIGIDGPEFQAPAEAALAAVTPRPGDNPGRIATVVLPHNTGADGFNGHRLYAALGFTTSGHFLCYLDQDNWFDRDHVRDLVDLAVAHGLEWSYALRRCWFPDGTPAGDDDCESLGFWPAWHGEHRHIDTSCYFLRRDVAAHTAAVWFKPTTRFETPDRDLCNRLQQDFRKAMCSGRRSVNYTMASSPYSLAHRFFADGNRLSAGRYGGRFPWCETVALEVIDPRPAPAAPASR